MDVLLALEVVVKTSETGLSLYRAFPKTSQMSPAEVPRNLERRAPATLKKWFDMPISQEYDSFDA